MGTITLKGIRKSFGTEEVIRGVDLMIEDRQFVVFVGPSGSGKSTLLRLIAGLEDVTEGTISIDGHDVTDVRPSWRGLAMVFQSYALFPHMTVRQNIGFGLKMAKRPKGEIDTKVNEAARILQIEPLLNRKPAALSGGQRQRVAIGRAIVRDPTAFLFDEPLSNLDAELRVQMRLEIAEMRRKLDATIIYVTHDQVEAMTLADRIVVLRDGHVEQIGSPLDLYHHPANKFVAGFIGSPTMNFLEGKLSQLDDTCVTIDLDQGHMARAHVIGGNISPGERVIVGLRPEHLRLVSATDAPDLSGRIGVIERLGGVTFVYLILKNGQKLTVQTDGDQRLQIGDEIGVKINPVMIHVFSDTGAALPPVTRHMLVNELPPVPIAAEI